MKKMLSLFVFLFLLFPAVSFAEFKLDVNRWEQIYSNDNIWMFIDKQTVREYSHNVVGFWGCQYYPNGCSVHNCVDYHFNHCFIDYDKNTMGYECSIVYDLHKNVIDGETVSFIEYEPIVPGSIGEDITVRVYDIFKRNKNKK